jgi:hypothetical protein
LEIEVYVAEVAKQPKVDGRWVRDLSTAALPTVMKKIVEHAFPDEGPLFRRN